MSKESFQKLLKAMSGLLKPLGYRKQGNWFLTTSTEGNTGFITVVKHRGPALDSAITPFTIEVAVASKLIVDRFRRHLWFPEKPNPGVNQYSTRIGYLMGKGTDFWWSLSEENEDLVIAEVLSALPHAFRFIDEMISNEALCANSLKEFELDDDGFRNNPVELAFLAYLLHTLNDKDNFERVASCIFNNVGDNEFENSSTFAEFVISLGYKTTEPLPKRREETNPYLIFANQFIGEKIIEIKETAINGPSET